MKPCLHNLLVCLDIDATICDAGWRHNLAGKEPDKKDWKKYKKWLHKVQSKKMLLQDRPVSGMKEFACILKKNAVYLTSRQSVFRKVTKQWLKKNGFPPLPLLMRQKGDRSRAGEYKEKAILALLKKKKIFHHVIVVDDDPRLDIAIACSRQKWTFLKAMSGS